MIPIEVREKIMAAHVKGTPISKISEECQVGERSIYRLIKHVNETGSIEPKPKANLVRGGRKPALDEKELEEMRNLVLSRPDITLAEIKENMGLEIGIAAVHIIISNKLGFQKQYVPADGSGKGMDGIRDLLLSRPDITLAEIKEELGLSIGIPAIHMIISDLLGFQKQYVQVDSDKANTF